MMPACRGQRVQAVTRSQVFALGFLSAVAMLAGLRALTRPSAPEPVLTPAVEQRGDVELPSAGMFLVARRALIDPYFAGTVVLLLEHGSHGSVGLIVNRRFRMTLADAAPDLGGPGADRHGIFFGGPLGSHQVFALLRDDQPVPDAQHVAADIYFSADREVLDKAVRDGMPGDALHFYLGYASWTAGQLAYEIAAGSWFLVSETSAAIFGGANEGLWERLIDDLEPEGIEVKQDRAAPLLAARTP
jgi:putative transcriptional regulator